MADPKDKQQRIGEAYARIRDLIGDDNIRKLQAAGFQVVIQQDFNNFVLAHAKESQRLRDLHAASERDHGRTSARAELILADGKVAVLLTAPACDEAHLGTCLADALTPVVKDLLTVRFDPKAVMRPEPVVPAVNTKGGSS
jgi:hypothetical protein